MFELLKNYPGELSVNNRDFKNVKEAEEYYKDYKGGLTILLKGIEQEETKQVNTDRVYQITVRRYMTNYSRDFFLEQWNPDGPMPYVTMIGTKIKETEKLIKMKLWADISENRITTCMCCGRPLSNPLSQYLGVGPECGASKHLKLLESGVSIDEVKRSFREHLKNIEWEGWIVKSAITQVKELKNYERDD